MHIIVVMDDFDDKILRELQQNGRITHTELGQRIGLSASATMRRVQELERQGVIAGYRAVVDPIKLGNDFVALIAVGLNDHSKASQETFERAMSTSRAVRECHNVTGSIEYILRVEMESLAAYKRFHSEVLGSLSQVSSISTYAVLESPKDERG